MMNKGVLLAIGMGVVITFTAHAQQSTSGVAKGDSLSVETAAVSTIVSMEQELAPDSLADGRRPNSPTKRDLRRVKRMTLRPRGVSQEQAVSELTPSKLPIDTVVSAQTEPMYVVADHVSDSVSVAATKGVALDQSLVVAATEGRRKGRFLPTSRRIDRQVSKGRFAYKGELMVGFTASYGKISSEDTQFLVLLNNIDLNGTIGSVKPFLGYFYKDNRCLGVRFGYQHMSGNLGNVDLDFGAQNDLILGLGGFGFTSDSYEFGLFHRAYVSLDSKGRFGLFAEVEASVMAGTSDFIDGEGDGARVTRSDNFKAKLSFNPGMSVYIFPNVCTSVSIGLGGLQYTSVTQHDGAGNKIGSRTASNMAFRINIFEINFGVSIHLWDKKKR